jgi:nucleotide-binding universal stress UspA family protein
MVCSVTVGLRGHGFQLTAATELSMRVLIATDCSPAAELVVAEAAARPWPQGTTFSILNVVDLHRFAGLPALVEESKRKLDQLGAFMKEGAAKLERAGYHAEVKVTEGFPRKVISESAKEWRADLIMVGSHGHSAVARFLIGSVAQGVLRSASCSVEVVRSRKGQPAPSSHPMKILLATDDSDCSVGAAHSVANRPWPDGTTFKVLSVEELTLPDGQMASSSLASIYPQSLLEELISYSHNRAESAVKTAREILERAGKKVEPTRKLPMGEPRAHILESAEGWGADLIVVASHGRRGLDRFLMGSVSEAVATYAPCSVEVIRN